MPYLNWKEENLKQQQMTSHPLRQNQMTLGLSPAQRTALLSALREVLEQDGDGELRLDLPKNWALFWKLREGESRLLLAHPQQDEWVGTLALEARHAKKVLERLGSLNSTENLSVTELSGVGTVSNLEVVLEISSSEDP